MKRVIAVVALSIVAVSPRPASSAGPSSPTIEQFLMPGTPIELVAAKRVERIAWTAYEHGLRNVYTAAAPAFTPVRLTNVTRDDGVELSDLAISDDGAVVTFVRGTAPNRDGWVANPTANPAGAKRTIWAARTAGGGAWQLGQGTTSALSPDGRTVAYAKDGQIYSYAIGADGSRGPGRAGRSGGSGGSGGLQATKPLVKAWGTNATPVWSPDGSRFAFVSNRVDHSLIGVYHVRTREVTFLAPSVDHDTSPTWSPDGTRVAFVRRPGTPFGQQAHQGSGGIGNPDGPAFNPLTAARSGNAGRGVRSARGQAASGQTDRPGLFDSALTGGYTLAFVVADAVLGGGAKRPFGVGLVAASGALRQAQGEAVTYIYPSLAQFPIDAEVTPQLVLTKAADGTEVHNQLFLPKDLNPGEKRPAIVFVHGGPVRQMLLGYHYMHFYHVAYAVNQWLASRGYVVMSVNYRSGIGYGKSFRTAPHTGGRGNAEYQDVLAGGKDLQTRADVDANRIGIWGLSYGGVLTAQALARNSDIFKVGVDLAGVHLWGNSLDPGNVAYQSSAISAIDTWKSPVLLVHGDDDRNVQFSQTTGLVQLLRAHNIYHELLVYTDDTHEPLLHTRYLHAFNRLDEFIGRFLKNAPARSTAGQ